MKKLLLVIDFQNDFVDGSLGFDKAKELEQVIYNKIINYKEKNDDVIYTLDTHENDYLETFEGKMLPVKHCIRGTFGHDLYGKIKELVKESDLIFEKNTFPSLELGNYLKDKSYDEIEICGLVSNICVISNAIIVKAALPNAKIIVNKNATASFDEDLNNKTFEVLKGMHIIVEE